MVWTGDNVAGEGSESSPSADESTFGSVTEPVRRFLLIFTGASQNKGVGEDKLFNEEWNVWQNSIDSAIIDVGIAEGGSSSIGPERTMSDAGSWELTGFMLVAAPTIAAAGELAMGSPTLSHGGRVDIYEVGSRAGSGGEWEPIGFG